MEFVDKLALQHTITQPDQNSNSEIQSSQNQNEIPSKLNEQRIPTKKWKNWSWKCNPGSKSASIEEEPESPKKSTSSKQSSPCDSPKHKQNVESSPLRRKKTPSPRESPNSRTDVRASAGARLYQLFNESNLDESGDELQTLLTNGRPASIHVLQTSKGH